MLQLNNLRLATHSRAAQLEFLPGQISVVLGRNNSGKTNLLRLIAGLSSSASGDVLLDGVPLPELSSRLRPVGYVFQAFVNYPHWSVRENIESPLLGGRSFSGPEKLGQAKLSKAKLSKAKRRERVDQIAETLQLSDLLHRLPAELSGGQQQRLAIGRALASDARVLLLDEPFVNLDFRLRERLTEDLGELLRRTNTTVLFASSDCRDAFALADALVLVAEQEVVQSATPLVAYRNPASIEAAHLMSEPAVNLVAHPDERNRLQMVRPEHLKLTRAELSIAEDEALSFKICVDAVETSGSHTYVQGALVHADSERGDAPRWVARLDGIRSIDLASASSIADGSKQTADKNSQVVEFFIDPRNVLEMVDHGAA